MKEIKVLTLTFIAVSTLYSMFNMTSAIAEETTDNYPSVDSGYFVDAVGTYFEITNSTYLNITLASTETVHVTLESAPRIVSLSIECNSSATSTTLTFTGFEPCSGYYRYQDGYLIEGFTTDSEGAYVYIQDISEHHHVFVQENLSTLFIWSDYTFTGNVYEPIIVMADNIVIDGNGYTLQGPGSGYGFYLPQRNNVTIKNVNIKGWTYGIYVVSSEGNTISLNTISSSFYDGIHLVSSNNNTMSGNTLFSNRYDGIALQAHSEGNIVCSNTASNNYRGIYVWNSDGNIVCSNTASNNSQGIYLPSSEGNTISNNTVTDGGIGIIISHHGDNTISGNIVSNCDITGILLDHGPSGNLISGNVVSHCGYVGIELEDSGQGNVISGNTVSNSSRGIFLEYSGGSTITGNMVLNNSWYGIYLDCSGNNILRNNSIAGTNRFNFGVNGWYVSEFIQDIDISNTVNGKPIYYWVNQENKQIPADAGYVTAVSSKNITVENLTLAKNLFGVLLVNTTNSIIESVNTSNNGMGIYLYYSDGNTVSGNIASNNFVRGIVLDDSDGNTINGNAASNNREACILIYYSDDNTIADNVASSNYAGVLIWESGSNTISVNSVSNNHYGIWLYYSDGNTIYHNNIADNVNQATDDNPAANNWHHPDLLEGNYWSDYPGVDDGSGTGKHAIAGDGIGDTSIPWPEPNYDYYPFTSESGWIDTTPPEITITIPEPFGLYIVDTALDFNATDAQSGVATIVGQLTNTAGEYQEVDSGFTPLPGVYTLVVVATDNRGNTAESGPVFFVVYDPEGGFATGGGWICPDEESTLPGGKANFGFVAKYKQDSSTGNLEFQYHDAEINLKSTTIDWLVISGVSAQFQGTAAINGEGIYTFRVRAKDNDEPGVGSDEFDIKIWEGTDTEADPLHKAKNILAGGNIVVHKK